MGRPAVVEVDPIPLTDEELTARLFRALGDSTRLAILDFLLENGPRPQKDIVEHVGLSQGRVSQHLSCLTWCGFVEANKQGRETHYRVASPRAASLIDLARLFLEATKGDIVSAESCPKRLVVSRATGRPATPTTETSPRAPDPDEKTLGW